MIEIKPPPRCESRRKALFIDKFWAWFWGCDLDVFERCWHYQGHAEHNPDQWRLQFHECAAGYTWPTTDGRASLPAGPGARI